jgi:hypothetical protein
MYDPLNKKYFVQTPVFFIFLKKSKKQASEHYFISPPPAAKSFLRNPARCSIEILRR